MHQVDFGLGVALLAGPLLIALVAGVARAAARGRLPRNGTIGLRLPSMLRSDAAWQAGHRAAQTPAHLSLGLLIAADLVAVLLANSGTSKAALTVELSVLLLAAIAWTAIAAGKAAHLTIA